MRCLSPMILCLLLLAACGGPMVQEPAPAAAPLVAEQQPGLADTIQPQALALWLQDDTRPVLLDVREPYEADIASIPGTTLQIPLGELENRMHELDPSQDIVVYCRSGNRSQQAMNIMQAAGFTRVTNLQGGILGWSAQVDPSMPTY